MAKKRSAATRGAAAKKRSAGKPAARAAAAGAAAKNGPPKKRAKKTALKVAKKTATKRSKKAAAKKFPPRVAKRRVAAQGTAAKTVKKAAKKSPKKAAAKKAAPKRAAVKRAAKDIVARKAAKKKAAAKGAKPSKKAPESAARKPSPAKAVVKQPAPRTSLPVPAKPSPEAIPPKVERRAYGMYNGILICENPKMMPRGTPYSENEIQALHQILLDERARLLEILRDLESLTFRNSEDEGNTVAPGYSIHLAENATDNIDTETALLLRRDEEEALAQVMAAIERLEEGLYGACMACGSKIGMARLRAKPDAHLCMKCQVRYDREARRH